MKTKTLEGIQFTDNEVALLLSAFDADGTAGPAATKINLPYFTKKYAKRVLHTFLPRMSALGKRTARAAIRKIDNAK